ncbi:Protein of unknown function (DUF3099) [Antricoccus suffuscus]|uniref:DUF3099 family protein n=1 Tax=Antricoccus suffuscus TaxID=1629062 RepID=A0A2T1A5M9_9ACTN|nr:DUF3099 domain-containing protein [Antricoccus suffuscus]PRZ43648.1 Protein of unknown function (DUF3099) [Antricoccus suffuscus]
MKRRHQATLVTGAALSRDEELRSRKKRYVITMVMRIVLLVAAALLVKWSLWVALAVMVVGVFLPWVAVVMANDGPPKNSKKFRAMHPTTTNRQLESPGGAEPPHKMIDGDVDGVPDHNEEDQ